eukprot:COSAG06_NODE_230_length_19685_cov_14.110844_6_plen_168_part_00
MGTDAALANALQLTLPRAAWNRSRSKPLLRAGPLLHPGRERPLAPTESEAAPAALPLLGCSDVGPHGADGASSFFRARAFRGGARARSWGPRPRRPDTPSSTSSTVLASWYSRYKEALLEGRSHAPLGQRRDGRRRAAHQSCLADRGQRGRDAGRRPDLGRHLRRRG